MKELIYFSHGLHGVDKDNRQISNKASTRLRVILPSEAIAKTGVEVRYLSYFDIEQCQRQIDLLSSDSVAFFGKAMSSANKNLPYASFLEQANAKGARTIFDLCDNHFETQHLAPVYMSMTKQADHVTCCTPVLREAVYKYTNRMEEVSVIPDLVEGVKNEARFMSGGSLKILWFGHSANLLWLERAIPSLKSVCEHRKVELCLLSLEVNKQKLQAIFQAKPENMDIFLAAWSLDKMQEMLSVADMVIIPTQENDMTRGKSANRLVESMWAGRFVVANHLPAYEEFNEMAWVGDSIGEGVEWALAHSDEIPGRVTKAQEYIEKKYALPVVVDQWLQVMQG